MLGFIGMLLGWAGVGREDDVLRDDDVDGVAGPDRDGRLDGEVLLGDLLAGAVDGAAGVGGPRSGATVGW